MNEFFNSILNKHELLGRRYRSKYKKFRGDQTEKDFDTRMYQKGE